MPNIVHVSNARPDNKSQVFHLAKFSLECSDAGRWDRRRLILFLRLFDIHVLTFQSYTLCTGRILDLSELKERQTTKVFLHFVLWIHSYPSSTRCSFAFVSSTFSQSQRCVGCVSSTKLVPLYSCSACPSRENMRKKTFHLSDYWMYFLILSMRVGVCMKYVEHFVLLWAPVESPTKHRINSIFCHSKEIK